MWLFQGWTVLVNEWVFVSATDSSLNMTLDILVVSRQTLVTLDFFVN